MNTFNTNISVSKHKHIGQNFFTTKICVHKLQATTGIADAQNNVVNNVESLKNTINEKKVAKYAAQISAKSIIPPNRYSILQSK